MASAYRRLRLNCEDSPILSQQEDATTGNCLK